MVHWCDITIELFYFDYKSNITFLEWKGEFIECLLYNYETVSNKYYSINGKPLPGTESPLDYTVSTTDVWITPDKAGKTIKVAENLNTAPRNGKVLFTQAESGRTYILPVQQSSATTRQTLQISTTAGNIPAAGGNKAVTAVLSTYYNDHRDPDKNIIRKSKCSRVSKWKVHFTKRSV